MNMPSNVALSGVKENPNFPTLSRSTWSGTSPGKLLQTSMFTTAHERDTLQLRRTAAYVKDALHEQLKRCPTTAHVRDSLQLFM